jgi:putative heme iron utilization protein
MVSLAATQRLRATLLLSIKEHCYEMRPSTKKRRKGHPVKKPDENFHAPSYAKRLIREARTGALATLNADGSPYASLVTVSTMPDNSPVMFLSNLAKHTHNFKRDQRVSLLMEERRPGDPLAIGRVSVMGKIAVTEDPIAARRHAARHGTAKGFTKFPDFNWYRIDVESAHLVAGFGRIVGLTGEDLRTDINDADELIAAEESAIEHMNEDHKDAISLYATKLLKADEGDWRIVSLDPEGCDLMMGENVRRLDFPSRLTKAGDLRVTLAKLAKDARAIAA